MIALADARTRNRSPGARKHFRLGETSTSAAGTEYRTGTVTHRGSAAHQRGKIAGLGPDDHAPPLRGMLTKPTTTGSCDGIGLLIAIDLHSTLTRSDPMLDITAGCGSRHALGHGDHHVNGIAQSAPGS